MSAKRQVIIVTFQDGQEIEIDMNDGLYPDASVDDLLDNWGKGWTGPGGVEQPVATRIICK